MKPDIPLIHFNFGGERIILAMPYHDEDGAWVSKTIGMDANVANRLFGELRQALDEYHADRAQRLMRSVQVRDQYIADLEARIKELSPCASVFGKPSGDST